MTVTSRKYFSDWFVANGVNKDWGFDFTILSQDDVIVQVRDGTDNTTIVNHTTDLGFYPAEDFASGTVRYPIVAAALAVGKQVRILREVAYFQPERIGKEGKFLPQTHEKAFDRVTILTQQVDNNLDLAVKVPIGATPLTVVADLAENRALVRQGDFLVAGPSVTEISSAQAYATQAGDSATLAQGFATTATNKANEAAASAVLAQNYADTANPTNFYTKTETDAKIAAIDLSSKVSKTGDTMTGVLSINSGSADAVRFKNVESSDWWIMKSVGGQLSFYWDAAGGNGFAGDKIRVNFDTGALWTAQLGDLYTHIENRAWYWGGTRASDWGNVANALANMTAGGVGSLVLAKTTVAVGFGGTVAGSNLSPSTGSGTSSGSLSGTWRCFGHASASGTVTLFLRIS